MEENQIARQFLRAGASRSLPNGWHLTHNACLVCAHDKETRLEHLVDPLVVAQAMKLVLTHSQPLLPAPLLPLLFAAIRKPHLLLPPAAAVSECHIHPKHTSDRAKSQPKTMWSFNKWLIFSALQR